MSKASRILPLLPLLVVSLAAAAAERDGDKFRIRTTDNLRTMLEQEMDRPVKVRLTSGQELSGTVVRLGAGVVQLSHVGGMEFYDAVINIDDISAVLLRVRKP